MRNLLYANVVAVFLLVVMSCGYQSRDSELIAQVKKVKMVTPLICPDFVEVDLSLGVMRNGVGSMSSQDVWMYVHATEMVTVLKDAVESGALVKVTYDQKRTTICVPNEQISKVELVK